MGRHPELAFGLLGRAGPGPEERAEELLVREEALSTTHPAGTPADRSAIRRGAGRILVARPTPSWTPAYSRRAFRFEATRTERHIVDYYEAASGGHFRPHRNNTPKGTAYRRFAVTINLNAEEYAGGDLRFPEYGPRTYRAPTGGAVVFSCAPVHEATPVTAGKPVGF